MAYTSLNQGLRPFNVENIMSTEDKNEFIDSQDDAETTENTDVEEQSEDITVVKEANKKLFERAKAAEEKLKALKKERYDAQVNAQGTEKKLETKPDVSVEELKLIARGLSDELIDEAKAIAKGKGIALSEALKTKTFLALEKEIKEEEKREQARLGASKGSSQSQKQTFRPGMTQEEHKKLWRETYGI